LNEPLRSEGFNVGLFDVEECSNEDDSICSCCRSTGDFDITSDDDKDEFFSCCSLGDDGDDN
jgi:hypothetical protein